MLTRPRLVIAALMLIAALGGAMALAAARDSEPTLVRGALPARSAEAFADSVGVNVHASYYDTSYANADAWTGRLRELGVRHVRDGIVPRDQRWLDVHRRLGEQGIRSSLIVGPEIPPEEAVAAVAGPLKGGVSALEGPNEPDLRHEAGWPERTREFMQRLNDAVQAQPHLGVPLIGPSLAWGPSRNTFAGSGGLWEAENLHSYAGGEPPETQLPDDIADARKRGNGRPVLVTETGYHNAVDAEVGQPGVEEEVAADYVPRTYLEAFAAGAQRTFLYELADEKPEPARRDPEQHFGLLRQDLQPKPAFGTLAQLMAVVRDSPGEGGRIPGAVDGGDDVQGVLLERGDGSRVLLLWRRVEPGIGPEQVKLRFGAEPDDVTVRDLRGGRQPSGVDRNALSVDVGAGVVAVSFR